MNVLASKGLHDLRDESWNAYGQFTYISSWKRAFSAPYTNANGSINSLVPQKERSFTATLTLFLGGTLWPGGEGWVVPELIAERPLSQLRGIGGSIQNFELQKGGSETPQLYRSRTFLRQTIGLGGESFVRPSDPMQLGGATRSRRLVLTLGNFTILDIMDRNILTGDPRRTFLNMSFMTHASWDFPSDARGYSWGGVAELYWDDWAFRLGRISGPKNPNQLPVNFNIAKSYGDQLEIEHRHTLVGQGGAVHLLAYRNHLESGRFDEAIAAYRSDPVGKNAASCADFSYNSGNFDAPDLCWVRHPNVKVGIGIDLEQHLTEDLGVFFRGMYSDGQSEVFAYNPADRSISFGAITSGAPWHRPFDQTGIGGGFAWISQVHADYLRMGGVDGFVGDGNLRKGTEGNFEVFYSFNLLRAIWLTADYQRLNNPGFNRDRGPVDIFGARVHAEF